MWQDKKSEIIEGTSARQDYTTVVELNPFHEQAYLETGRLLLEQHLIEEAIRSGTNETDHCTFKHFPVDLLHRATHQQ